MKKVLSAVLSMLILLLCGCQAAPTQQETTVPTTAPVVAVDVSATAEEAAALEKLYEGRVAYHGDTHVHTQSGEKSDGKLPLDMWADAMAAKKVDFVAVADHRQTTHYSHEAWDDTIFIGASEGGMRIKSVNPDITEVQSNHTNYIFPTREAMEGMLQAFPLYFNFNIFNGTYTDWGCGNVFTREVAQDLIRYIQDNGGFFVLLHPASPNATEGPKSGELMDFWLADYTGFEVFIGWYGPSETYEQTKDAYELWKQLLAAGKKIYAMAGSDTHLNPKTEALSTMYVTEKSAQNYIDCLRAGDFSPSPMGVRMVIGDTRMGGETSFAGQKVVFSVGDFHSYVTDKRTNFRAVLVSDKGTVTTQNFTADETVYFSVDADADASYYYVEIYDADEDLLIGLGNPIWNVK